MPTIEDKQELLDIIAGKPRIYRITIWGRGGEHVWGRITKAQLEFWEEVCSGIDSEGYDMDGLFGEYLFDKHQFAQDYPEVVVPESAEFEWDWYEYDDLLHTHGANCNSSHISIVEIDENFTVLDTIIECDDVRDFINMHDPDVTTSYHNLEVFQEPDGHNRIVHALSSEKGTFFDGVINLTRRIDVSKIGICLGEYPDSITKIEEITYLNEVISNDGGETATKSLNAYVTDY